MPASFSSDLKSYVRLVPIPVTSHKGIRIQARSHTVYNATVPTRDEVRHENYSRRQMQMSYQGFQSAKNRPYQGIGDPFYLEPKKLVLHALGQWDNEDDCNPSETDESIIEEDILHSEQKDGHKYKMHASRKKNDSNELNKRLAYGRRMIRTVSLGRSFQNIVRAEAENKIRMAEKELNDARELMRTTMRPPKIKSSPSSSSSSSSSFDDEEVDDDNDGDYDDHHHTCVTNGSGDLQECASHGLWKFSPYRLRPFSSVVVHNRDSRKVQDANMTPKSKSASGIRIRSQNVAQRPYTPQHANIAAVCNSSTDKYRGSVFRQLCVIYWLLEAMNLDPPRITRPVSTCWSTSDVNETDNDRTKRFGIDRAKQESKREARWKQFSSPQTVRANRRGAGLRANATKMTRPEGAHNLESASICSVSDTWDQRSHTAPTDDNTTHEEIEASNHLESTSKSDATECSRDKCPSPKNCENQDVSPTGHSAQQDSSLSDLSLNSSCLKKQNSVHLKTLDPLKAKVERKELRQLYRMKMINCIDQAEPEPYNRQKSGLPKNLPAEAIAKANAEASVRPKSSAAVLQHQELSPSDKYKNVTPNLRQRFAEVSREQNMILKDALNAHDRNRLKEIEHKVDVIPTDANVRTALQAIRLKEESKQQNKAEKEPEIYQPWFLILMKSLSEEMKSSWFFQKMLDKLSRYGLVEAGKQSDFKFIKILAGLREWEICSPDISAAVEFCREKIVEMNVDEYEKWFSETFPSISRPQPQNLTAKSTKKEEPIPGHRSIDRNRAKSAPMGIRQTRI